MSVKSKNIDVLLNGYIKNYLENSLTTDIDFKIQLNKSKTEDIINTELHNAVLNWYKFIKEGDVCQEEIENLRIFFLRFFLIIE